MLFGLSAEHDFHNNNTDDESTDVRCQGGWECVARLCDTNTAIVYGDGIKCRFG